MVETEGSQMTSQYGAYALHAGLVRLHALMRMHTLTCPGTHMHAHPHTNKYVTYCFSTATMISEPASLLRYAYIACVVSLSLVSWKSESVLFNTLISKKLNNLPGPQFIPMKTQIPFSQRTVCLLF